MDTEDKCALVCKPHFLCVIARIEIDPWCDRDNRITIHNASWDYEGSEPRHGTRVTSLAEKPYFDPDAPTRRQALGLDDD